MSSDVVVSLPAAVEVFRRLRRVRRLVDLGEIEYGGLYGWNVHALRLPGVRRFLTTAELGPWSQGFMDPTGLGGELLACDRRVVPVIVSPVQAAAKLGRNYKHALRRKVLADYYPIYVANRVEARHIIEAELDARVEGASRAAVRAWTVVEASLPARLEHAKPPPVGRRAPGISPAMVGIERRHVALEVATRRSWLTVLRNESGREYTVQTAVEGGRTVRRDWGAADLEAYVLGVADRHGEGRRVTFREGLG